jgi:hypothetical protein
MRYKIFSILVVFVVLLSSCWKDEEPFILPAAGDAIQSEVSLGPTYDKMIYFNVNTQEFVIRDFKSWDLSFQTGENEFHVFLNTGNLMLVHETNLTDFDATYSLVSGMEWRYDLPNGNLDSTAIGKWWSGADGTSKGLVYVIDMGITYTEGERYKKFQVEKADATGYTINIGDLNDNTTNRSFFIPKDDKRNLAHFNITSGTVITDLEPEKDNWDLWFTSYNHIFHDQGPEPIPYQVRGVLQNSANGVRVYEERTKSFDEIDIDYAASLSLDDDADVIGYDWKNYDQDAGRYTVDNSITYIIKTVSGYYYKVRFIDYYDQNGLVGTPVFDLQRL